MIEYLERVRQVEGRVDKLAVRREDEIRIQSGPFGYQATLARNSWPRAGGEYHCAHDGRHFTAATALLCLRRRLGGR